MSDTVSYTKTCQTLSVIQKHVRHCQLYKIFYY